MYHALTVFCATAFALVAGQEYTLPIQTCHHDAPDYTSCMRLAIEEAWPILVAGIPELDLPVLDPYFIKEERTVFENADMNADITVRDVNAYGLAKLKFLAVRTERSDNFFKVEADVSLSKALIEGNYKADGTFGAMKFGGDGFFNLTMEDITATLGFEGGVANDRWTIEHFYLHPEIGKMEIWFSDMFNGNEDLNNAARKFVNEYWPSLYRMMMPFMTKNMDDHVTEVFNRIFSKVSFSKTFP
ncbi:protein takeout [Linepithema humile]|uniref:protein takeout n=1 Tax=Linepithema humile TaxID=83485 RepID=UPI000623170A|nr:PREDICTED: uncharacterized protein LOC105670441 [Linepithema humile]